MPVPSDSRYSFRRVPSKWSCHDVNTGSDFQPQELHSSQAQKPSLSSSSSMDSSTR